MFKKFFLFLAVFGLLTASVIAKATLVTSAPTDGTVIDFSQFAFGCPFGAPGCRASDTPNVGGLVGETVLFSGTAEFIPPNDLFLGSSLTNERFGLGENGAWDEGRNGFAGNGLSDASMEFMFLNGPVSFVGGFLNYAVVFGSFDTLPPTLEVLDAGLNVLESYDIFALAPISTSILGTNDGAFRGISRATNDIFALRWSGSFSVLDDLTFVRKIPEPTTLALLVIGLAGLASAVRRKK